MIDKLLISRGEDFSNFYLPKVKEATTLGAVAVIRIEQAAP